MNVEEIVEYNLEYFNEALTDEQIANSMLDKVELEAKLQEKDKEIERLNNIIDEVEKHLLEYLDEWQDIEGDFVKGRCLMARDVIYDIYELKEGK